MRVLGRFPQQAPLEIDGEILRFAALQLSADAETIHAYARRQQTVSAHQRRIGQYLRLRTFDTAAGEQPGAVPRGRSAAARSHGLAAGAGAGLASRRTRPRPGRLGAAPRGGGCPAEGPRPADATHSRASVGVDARPPRCAGRRRRRSALASAPHQDRLVEPVGRWHEAASGAAGTDRGDRGAGNRHELGQRQLSADPVPQRPNRIGRPGVRDGGPAPAPRAGVLPAPGVARPARPGRRHVRQASSTATASWSRTASTTCSRRNARPSTGSFTATAGSARCCSIPTSATTSCGPDCCQPCPRRSCARTSPTWRTGPGATGRPASSRRPSGTPG